PAGSGRAAALPAPDTGRAPPADPTSSHRRRLRAARGALQILEELAVRRHHQHIAVGADGLAIGLQAAVERIELRIAAIGLGIDLRRLGIALTADDLRLAIGLGKDLD